MAASSARTANFVDDSAQCARYSPPLTPTRLATCQAVTRRIPERIESINKGLNTLHFYQMTFNPNRPGELAAGAQDNGSWMSVPGTKTWIETFVADGAFNGFDATNANYSMFSWQNGAIAALDEPRNQQAGFWIADTLRTLGANTFRYRRRGGRVHRSDALPSERQQADAHGPRARLPLAERRRQPRLPLRGREGALQRLDRRR